MGRLLGVNARKARNLYDSKQQVPQFLGHSLRVAGDRSLPQLLCLFGDLVERRGHIRPLKAGHGRFGLDLFTAPERRQTAGHAVHRLGGGRLRALALLDRVPVRCIQIIAPEHVRVAVDELPAGRVRNIVNIEMPGLALNIRVEQHLHEHIAQLFLQVRRITGVDGLTGLIRLLQEVSADALMCLHLIPRTAARRAQERDERHKVAQVIAFFAEKI